MSSLVLIILLFTWLIWVLRGKSENGLVRTLVSALKMYAGWLGAAQASILLIIVLVASSKDVEANRIQRETLTRLEIIRPITGEERYVQLRALYFSMKTEKTT